jgi:hypothetical protein
MLFSRIISKRFVSLEPFQRIERNRKELTSTTGITGLKEKGGKKSTEDIS